jgi:type IV secretion system protein TrbL
MNGTGVIDHFLKVFTRYIDGGFGLLTGEVGFIATTLIVIDVTLAALFWTWGADNDIIARLVKKTLFVGAFAWIIGNWNGLAKVIFNSFAGLGLKASGTAFTVADLMRPGKVAQTGLDTARPLLTSIADLVGFVSFFENFVQIACLLFAWALVLLAFFLLAVQLFITLIEFKLTTLAGFVLMPFGLFGKSAFMAERVLGNVISSGIKVMVLAIIFGIGATLFREFTDAIGDTPPSIDDAMAIVLAALTLLGLGIFGPGIATGIVSGGPQLGAGAAVGTALAAGGMVAAGGAAVGAAASGGAALAGGAAAASRAGAALAGGARAAYSMGAFALSISLGCGLPAYAQSVANGSSTGAC